MKFICNREILSDAIGKVSRAVALRSTIAALEGIYFRTEESSLYICGYNLDLGISTKVLANIYEEGSVVLSSKLFCDIVRKMPGDKLEITCAENLITTIKSSEAEYSIIGISASDFPELPIIESDRRISISQGLLKSMIAQTLFAVSDNDSRPVCTGTLFEITEDKIRLVSVDGFRLAMRTEPITGTFSTSFIVPKKTLEEISRLMEDTEEKRVEICATRRHIEFAINGCVIISRLIEGEFLDYNNAIPQNNNTEVRVGTRRMIEATERMSLLISDAIKSPVRCVFGDNAINFNCRTTIGSATDLLAAEAPNEPIEIGFNNRYLMDAFRAVSTDEMRLIIGSPVNPVKVLPPEGENFLFLLLPVRLQKKD